MQAKIYTQELLDPAVVLEESFPETPAGTCIYLERLHPKWKEKMYSNKYMNESH